MIWNNYQAMRHIVDLRDEALTPDLVREIHRIVTDGTLDDPVLSGVIQDDDENRVAVWGDEEQLLHRPPSVAELPERLDRLCAFANGVDSGGYVPPVLRAVTVHFMMGYDHYFADGNGRTARAVFYWAMLHQGYWLTEFLTISRILKRAPAQYARSYLLTEQDGGDLTYFFVHHLEVIRRAIADLHRYLGEKAKELHRVQVDLRALPGEFTTRQLALLKHALSEPEVVYTVTSHSRTHGVSDETARQDLRDLERRGYLVRSKLGKKNVWRPDPELTGLLR